VLVVLDRIRTMHLDVSLIALIVSTLGLQVQGLFFRKLQYVSK